MLSYYALNTDLSSRKYFLFRVFPQVLTLIPFNLMELGFTVRVTLTVIT